MQTKGRWWTETGFVDGVCHHDKIVHKFEPVEQPVACPRFIPAPLDLHVHGGGGFDCMHGEAAIRGTLRSHAQHGTGSLLATSVTAPFDKTTDFIHNAAKVIRSPDADAAILRGVHLEGPFISPDRLGAQPPHPTSINLEQLTSWLETGIVRVITFAPELNLSSDLITLCSRYNTRAQIGHSVCSWEQAQNALRAGCGVTHLYNAMSGASHRQGGAVTASLAYADYAEIILDGLHVDQAAFDAAKRAIPGLYSVTDATAASGMPDGSYTLGSQRVNKHNHQVLLPDGTLAGSCLTQRRVIDVLRNWGASWHTIGSLISAIPGRWLGDTAVCSVAINSSAHWLEIVSDKPVALWLHGKRKGLKNSGTVLCDVS